MPLVCVCARSHSWGVGVPVARDDTSTSGPTFLSWTGDLPLRLATAGPAFLVGGRGGVEDPRPGVEGVVFALEVVPGVLSFGGGKESGGCRGSYG